MKPGSGSVVAETGMIEQFEHEGFLEIRGVLSAAECNGLTAAITPIYESHRRVARSRTAGVRNLLLNCSEVAELANSESLRTLLEPLMEGEPFPVRAILFDKTADTNWPVPWHQDGTIVVEERIETAGFHGWSVKEGVPHVQAPVGVLEKMVIIRLHLDDAPEDNGALRVIPGSHRAGRLASLDEATWLKRPAHTCVLGRGSALLMRPLLLHASSASQNPSHRRVLHIEYASSDLPNGLKWFGQNEKTRG